MFHPRRAGSRRSGFTLIEVLLAALLLSVVTYLMWQMLIGGVHTGVSGIWRETTNQRLQQASERIRKALEGASFPSILSPEMNVLDVREDHWVSLGQGSDCQGRDTELGEGASEAAGEGAQGSYKCFGPGRKTGGDQGPKDGQVLLFKATNCTPGRQRMEGLSPPNQEGKAEHYYFWLEGARKVQRGEHFGEVMDLRFATEETTFQATGELQEDQQISTGGGGPPSEGKLLVSDVNSVRMRILDKTGAEVDSAGDDQNPTLEMVIRCVAPDDGKATLGKVIRVQLHTGVKYQ